MILLFIHSPDAQHLAEELFKLRKDFLDEKFSEHTKSSSLGIGDKTLSTVLIPNWDSTASDINTQHPTVVSVCKFSKNIKGLDVE